mmetsp:Transcript_62169/g.131345  ORF Transcript_62169/g.131345 Transcript_62169/m.131345 type:complete len:138 (-) Transcript_62169:738-1151(-)
MAAAAAAALAAAAAISATSAAVGEDEGAQVGACFVAMGPERWGADVNGPGGLTFIVAATAAEASTLEEDPPPPLPEPTSPQPGPADARSGVAAGPVGESAIATLSWGTIPGDGGEGIARQGMGWVFHQGWTVGDCAL